MDKANKKSVLKRIMLICLAVILSVAALFALWWYGAFLPKWVNWETMEGEYYDTRICLSGKQFVVQSNDSTVWKTQKDWFVQDVIIADVDRDNIEELVLLVWKHGSFGKHKPMWVKRNDIRIEQHVFIYKYDSSRDNMIRPVWMSSTLGYQVESIERMDFDKIIINDKNNNSKVWYWQDFGLKLAGEAKEYQVSVVSAGDNLIHQWMYKYGECDGYDYVNGNFDSFYRQITAKISEADIATVNQETPLVEDNSLLGDYPRFGTPATIAESLAKSGFDIVSVATNHSLDRGEYGLNVTYKNIVDSDMVPVGINLSQDGDFSKSVTFYNKNHIRFAFLSYTYGTNGIVRPQESKYIIETFDDEERLKREIRYARNRADVVVVFAHWGTEYSQETDDNVLGLTNVMYDEGVDVVIGTHPHVIQNMEIIEKEPGRKMVVYYSLGNFVSGQNEPQRLIGALATYDIYKHAGGTIEVINPNMEKLIMHQDSDECTVYMLSDYTDELANRHTVEGMKEYIRTIKNP